MKSDKYNIENRGSIVSKPKLDLLKGKDKRTGLDTRELVTACLEQNSFSAATIYLVNNLAHYFKCDRVCIGMKSGQHTRLSSMSNNASFDRKTNLIRHIEAVMDEAVDESSTILYPTTENNDPGVRVAHSQFIKLYGSRVMCTVPLRHHGKIVGALFLEKIDEDGFGTRDVQQLEDITRLIGPMLHIMYRDQRSITKRLADDLNDFCVQIFGKDKVVSRGLTTGLFLLLLVLSIFPASYRVTADAIMEGSIQRIISAPVSGYISTSNKRAGDIINAGDVIATLDDKDLKLEEITLISQREQLLREYRGSLATNERSNVSVLNSKIKQIDAKLDLVSEQLSRLKLVSPINGIIIEGDLNQSIGSPVTRGDPLFKISPVNDYRVILKVDESEISHIEAGQTGQLTLSALPGENIDISVSRITPVSVSLDGRTFFRVEAMLNNNIQKLQPGMEGIGKIYIGDRKLLWVLTHKIVDRMRLLLWRFSL